MRLNKRQEALSERGHDPQVFKRSIGMTPTAPSRPVYGTGVRCSCGWKWTTNESPTKGGGRECIERWEEHATEATTEPTAPASLMIEVAEAMMRMHNAVEAAWLPMPSGITEGTEAAWAKYQEWLLSFPEGMFQSTVGRHSRERTEG